jgi:hypothetical protein
MPDATGDLSSPADLLLFSVERELHFFEQFLLRKEVAVPQPGQAALARILQSVSRQARQAMRQEMADLGDDPQPEDKQALALRYHQFLVDLQQSYLDYLRETDQSFSPPEIRLAITNVLGRVASGCKLVMNPCADPVPNISWSVNLEQYLCSLLIPDYSAPTPESSEEAVFVFLSYPQLHARDVFFQTIVISHEILHLRDHVRGLSQQLAGQINLAGADFSALVEDLRSQRILAATPSLPPITFGERFEEEQLKAFISAKWSEIMLNWLREVISDLLAVRLFGPCYIVAFSNHSLLSGVLAKHSDTHPSSRLRLELILAELRDMKYGRQQSGVLAVPTRQIQGIRGLLARPTPTTANLLIHQTAERYLRKARRQITELTRQEVGAETYLSSLFKQEVSSLIELLDIGVPPGELLDCSARTAHPAGLPAILNVAYVFQASHLTGFFDFVDAATPESRIESLSKLDELLLKALELSEVSLAWAAAEQPDSTA